MIYILSATRFEVRHLLKTASYQKLKINRIRVLVAKNWVLIITGVGKERVSKTLDNIADQLKFSIDDVVINCGLAGGFDNPVGKVFQIDRILSGTITQAIANRKVFFDRATLYTAEKYTIFNDQTGVSLIDMEAATVYQKMKSVVNEVYIFKAISDPCFRKERNLLNNFLNCYQKIASLFKLDGSILKLNRALEKVIIELTG